MSDAPYKLTEGALEIIMNGGHVPDPIIQVLGSIQVVSRLNNNRYRISVSDGKFSYPMTSYIHKNSENDAGNNVLEINSIVKLNQYIISNGTKNQLLSQARGEPRILVIVKMELIAPGRVVKEKIGNPVPLSSDGISGLYKPQLARSIDKDAIISRNFLHLRNNNTQTKDLICDYQNISPISSIHPFFNNWLIKARVINKTEIFTWSNTRGDGKLFSIALLDASGDIRCTFFNESVDQFYDKIEVDKIYFLCKCGLKLANRQFNTTTHVFEMSVNKESIIEECLDDDETIPRISFNFVPINLLKETDVGDNIDVIGVCKSVSNLYVCMQKSSGRELKKRELILMDQSGFAIVLTLWGKEAENYNNFDHPIIAIKSAKLSEFGGGKNLTTTLVTIIKINPNITEAHKLRAWFDLQGCQIQEKNLSARLANINPPWFSLAEVEERRLGSSEHGDYFQVCATMIMVKTENCIYKSCPNEACKKKVIDLENGMFRCEKCNREYSNHLYGLIARALIADTSGSLWISLFTDEVEKALAMTSSEIGTAFEEDPENLVKIFDKLNYKQFIFKCKAQMDNYNDSQRIKIVVIRMDFVDLEGYNSQLVENIEKLLY